MSEELEVVVGYSTLGALIGTALALVLVVARPGADTWLLPAAGAVLFALVTVVFLAFGVLP